MKCVTYLELFPNILAVHVAKYPPCICLFFANPKQIRNIIRQLLYHPECHGVVVSFETIHSIDAIFQRTHTHIIAHLYDHITFRDVFFSSPNIVQVYNGGKKTTIIIRLGPHRQTFSKASNSQRFCVLQTK